MQDRLTDMINGALAYVHEQALTTFGIGYLSLLNKWNNSLEAKQGYSYIDPTLFPEVAEEEDRVEDAQMKGMLVGIAQDVACAVGSIAYLAGNDSKLVSIVATVTGIKLATNLLSAAGYGIYSFLKYEDEMTITSSN
ncbi:MAG: hypothetical protein V3V78_04635 [Candidatus Woesearchaeota archaeon]